MTKRSINIRIYSGTVDKWFSMGVLSLVWHMTSFGLYYRTDCTMCVLSKSLQTRALPTNIQPDPYTVPACAAWISATSGWDHKAEAGGAVYPPVVLDSFPQLCSIHRRPLINRLVYYDRFSEICNTFIRTSYILTIHQYWYFPHVPTPSLPTA